MYYKHTNKFTRDKLSEWVIHCDICGMPTWFSDAVTLEPETGKGGLLVCPNDADCIDYGLVPYTIPNESTVDITRINETIYTSTPETTYSPFNPTTTDPMSTGNVGVAASVVNKNWEELTILNWEDMTEINWEDMV